MATRDQIQALKVSEIPPGSCRKAYTNGKEIAVFNVGGQFYATQAACTHAGGPLCEGELAGNIITCPWHGSQFNVQTGEVVMDPATEPLVTYSVKVQDDILVVEF
jgi:nitrite reductase/ring-hydroxylating ferredoxin subunit